VVRVSRAWSISIMPPERSSVVGEETTVRASFRGRRAAPVILRWRWEEGGKTRQSDVTVPTGADRHGTIWHGTFHGTGIHRIDLHAVHDDHIGATAFIVVRTANASGVAISGQTVRERTSGVHRAIPIGLVLGTAGEGAVHDEVRWLDGGVEVRSREVHWVMDAPDGWLHVGGTAAGALGALNPFRAHFHVAHEPWTIVDRAEIRLYPPGANPGADPPQRVIVGPVHAARGAKSLRRLA
jgi:hypothetical protein